MIRTYLFLPLTLGLFIVSAAIPVEEDAATVGDSLSDAACTFAVELLKTVAAEGEDNVVTSPVSIGAVLAMLQQGAKGATAEQIEKVLRLSPEKSKEAFSVLATFLKDKERNVTLEWANGIFIREDFVLNEGYKKTIEENFRSVIEKKNFTHPSAEETADGINKWIGDVTHGQISDLVRPSMINVDTVMILANAIYFKGIWESQFLHVRSRPGKFYLSVENVTQATFMRQEKQFPAGEDASLGIKWVELPYQDEDFSMLFILPEETNGLHKLIETINGADLKRIIANNSTRHVNLAIPKFKLKWSSSVVGIMSKMGLIDIFTQAANLEGISSSSQALSVSDIVHQANVEVDEDGTVASGATAGFVQVLSLFAYDDEMIFYADHPFLAFIVDKKRMIPLFVAKVGDPTSGKPAVNPQEGISPV